MNNEHAPAGKTISVIVLSYNNLSYYRDCLDSVFVQTYPDIELIVSDDCSVDFDRDEIHNYILTHKKNNIASYKIIHNKSNIGTVKNFNNAIRQSAGDYILGLSIDDTLYDKDTLTDIEIFFRKNSCRIFSGYRDVHDAKMENFIERLPRKSFLKYYRKNNPRVMYKKLCKGNFISGACTPFTRELFDTYGYFDEDYRVIEDYPKYLNLTRNNCMISFMERPIIKYRLGGTSNSDKSVDPVVRDIILAFEKEILPFKKKTGLFIHRLCKYEIISGMICNRFKNHPGIRIKRKLHEKILLNLAYIDIAIYMKLKHIIFKVLQFR